MRIILHRPLIFSIFVLAILAAILPRWAPSTAAASPSGLIISEVAPWSSGNSPASLAADWFEVTNTSGSAVNITGWKMDDNSNSFANSVALNGIASIGAGESVIFIETANLAAASAAFKSIWFGGTPHPSLQIGSYTGSGVGLSTSGDAVNLYNAGGVLQANVVFGASQTGPAFASFDNGVGLDSTTISTLSVAGVRGAFGAAADVYETGSPGTISGRVFISEVAAWSSGTTFGADWFEVTNSGPSAVNIAGWKMDNSSALFANAVTLNGITTIASGESVIFIESATPAATVTAFKTLWFGASAPPTLQVGTYTGANVGLSTAGDAVNLYDGGGILQANLAFGASPAGPSLPTFGNTVGLSNTTTSQLSVSGVNSAFPAPGDLNEVGSPGTIAVSIPPIVVNEVESNGGSPADWIEFINTGSSTLDISGYVFKDNNDAHTYTFPVGSIMAPGAYLVLNQSDFGFELDSVDSARLFLPGNSFPFFTYSWLEHSSTTYGRCPNGTGAFTSTLGPTKGATNLCATYMPWPGDSTIAFADSSPGPNFNGNLSGLIYEGSGSAAPGVLWAVRNGPETLFRLVWDNVNSIWKPDTANSWGTGKQLRYTNGSGQPDSEGVTFAGGGSAGGIFVATERDNNPGTTSRPSILRFDPSAAGATLTATNEWNLTANLPALGANLGLEGITWVPDTFLVARGFYDESKSHAYLPSEYPNHGTGLFFVGVENDGFIYAYALDLTTNNVFTRIATIDSGFPGIMELQFDRELNNFWAVCDDTCQGRTHIMEIAPTTGRFIVGLRFERPAGMPNLNNEGFAMASQAECVNHRKPAFWTDDSETGGHSLRRGTVPCEVNAASFQAQIAAAASTSLAPKLMTYLNSVQAYLALGSPTMRAAACQQLLLFRNAVTVALQSGQTDANNAASWLATATGLRASIPCTGP